ncbi:MAG: hypothetical protein ABQ298_03585 [Puniceicoccaceae bacterium]
MSTNPISPDSINTSLNLPAGYARRLGRMATRANMSVGNLLKIALVHLEFDGMDNARDLLAKGSREINATLRQIAQKPLIVVAFLLLGLSTLDFSQWVASRRVGGAAGVRIVRVMRGREQEGV